MVSLPPSPDSAASISTFVGFRALLEVRAVGPACMDEAAFGEIRGNVGISRVEVCVVNDG